MEESFTEYMKKCWRQEERRNRPVLACFSESPRMTVFRGRLYLDLMDMARDLLGFSEVKRILEEHPEFFENIHNVTVRVCPFFEERDWIISDDFFRILELMKTPCREIREEYADMVGSIRIPAFMKK